MLSKLDPPFLKGETVVLRSSVRRWLDKNILIYGSGHTWQLIYISMRGPLSDIRTKALPRLLATTLFACVVFNYPTLSLDSCRIRPPPLLSIRNLFFLPTPVSILTVRHVTTSPRLTLINAASCPSELHPPQLLMPPISISISILIVAFSAGQCSPNPDSPSVLAPSVGHLWKGPVCWGSQITVNYVKKIWLMLHLLFKYYFNPVLYDAMQYVFNKCGIFKKTYTFKE